MLKLMIEITGWSAAALMLSAYLLLTMGKISAGSRIYQWLNVLSGAGLSSIVAGMAPTRRRQSTLYGWHWPVRGFWTARSGIHGR